jgi:DNA-binding winged helix-turn-helix (wHTH) protein
MATRTLTVLEDAAFRIPLAELTADSTPSEWTVPPSSGNSSSIQESVTQFEPDKYRIALVSFQNGADRADGRPSRTVTVNQFFLFPLTWKELVRRVRGGLGQASSSEENKIAHFGRVSIDPLSMEVRRSDYPVSLTAMEFNILNFFVANPNRVFSRDQLLNEVWGYENYPCSRTVDNHVLKLRQKLELEPAEPVHFLTVHGVGYKFIP